MSITDELREYALGWDERNRVRRDLRAIADRIDAEHEGELLETGNNILRDVRRTWVLLPKDADDVPWNVGDRDEDGNAVTQLRLSSDGWFVITDGLSAYHPEQRRHYHAPTVEDLLREFAYGLGVPVADSYVAATAAKLQLREGE